MGKKSESLSRRKFIGQAGIAAAAFTIVPGKVLAGRGYPQPSDMLNIACIGISNQGRFDIQEIATPDVPIKARTPEQYASLAKPARDYLSMVEQYMNAMDGQASSQQPVRLGNIFALCDVDPDYAGIVFAGYPKAKRYDDWRKMLEAEKSIDAVVIATPDHNHAPIAAAFMRQKKHVYVEKPMAKTIYECRKLTELAKEYNVVTQMGNQGHASEGTRQTVEWIQAGLIGDVREVRCFTGASMWKQGDLARPAAAKLPKNLNWDVWLGPAPEKPFNQEVCHFVWRGLWDYGTGLMGDLGAHNLDAVVWALNLGYPTRIQATSTPFSSDYLPLAETVEYEFPDRYTPGIGYMPAVKLIWTDGSIKPMRPASLEPGRPMANVTYIGDKGVIIHGSHGAMPEFVPKDRSIEKPEPWLMRTGNIFEDWIGAIKNGKKSSNDFSVSSKLTEIMLLTNIATRVQNSDKILEYDSANMRVTNVPEANNYFHYEYRKGWTL